MVGKLDTKKIDNVETPPSYRVDATVETHDEQRRGGGEERQEEDEYSETGRVKGWQKFHTDAQNRRALKLRRRDITKIFLNQAFLQKGLVIIDADVQLINGHVLKHVHLFSTKIDTYWKLKKFGPGTEIPVAELVTEDYIEISVLHRSAAAKDEASAKGTAGHKEGFEEEKKTSIWSRVKRLFNG